MSPSDAAPDRAALHLSDLCSSRSLRERLRRAGLHNSRAAHKAKLMHQAAEALRAAGATDSAEVYALFVPGRIEVVGKHVDYAGGRSITCAIDRGFCLVVQPRDDDTIRLLRADTPLKPGGAVTNPRATRAEQLDEASFPLAADLTPTPEHWTNYPMTCARRIARNFPEARRGADIAFVSDLPPAAGLSSSSALVTAIFFALSHVNSLSHTDIYQQQFSNFGALAGYLGAIENGATVGALEGDTGVGTFGGSQDHTAIIGGKADHLAQFQYCPVRHDRYIPMPAGYTFAIGVSGAEAVKTGAAQQAYNDAATLAADAATLWREKTGRDDVRLADVLRASEDAPQRMRDMLNDRPELLTRFEHFYAENNQIVPAVGDAFARRDVDALGPLLDRSQQLAEEKLANQVAPTMHLARSARKLGAAAGSAFGAGFGGSVWALVRNEQLETFIADWSDDYRAAHPEEAARAAFFHAHPGPGALALGAGALASP